MLSTLALSAAAIGPHWGWGVGFPIFAILFPLFWIGVIVLIIALARRGRRGMWAGGPGGYGPWAHGVQAARSAEATLAERFANGDIDEIEYRARLEVIRANAPQPPQR